MDEVHAVDRADEGGGKEDCRPTGDALDLVVLGDGGLGQGLDLGILARTDHRQVDAQYVLQQLAEPRHLLLNPDRVVLHVPQVPAQLRIDTVCLGPGGKAIEDPSQGLDGPLELADLARQLVGAASDIGDAPKDLGLDLVDVVLQPEHHWCIVVDYPVEDGVVEDGRGATPQEVGLSLHELPDAFQVELRPVANGDDEVGANEDVELAELDRLSRVEVAGGAQDDEERAIVALQLRPLVGFDGILHRELVQAELLGDPAELAV